MQSNPQKEPMTTNHTEENRIKLLNDFAEYCHEQYRGCVKENDEWLYQYGSEVVVMAESYLKALSQTEGVAPQKEEV